LSKNSADFGGGMYNANSPLNLINVLIRGNTGGIYNGSGSGVATNVTMVDNGNNGYYAYGWVHWKNSIVWDDIDGNNFDAENSIIKGENGSSNGNIDATNLSAEAIFVDPENENYNLRS